MGERGRAEMGYCLGEKVREGRGIEWEKGWSGWRGGGSEGGVEWGNRRGGEGK